MSRFWNIWGSGCLVGFVIAWFIFGKYETHEALELDRTDPLSRAGCLV